MQKQEINTHEASKVIAEKPKRKRMSRHERKRLTGLSKIERNKKIEFCYIKKNGMYYRSDHCGYTDYKHFAGVYSKEEAIRSAEHCRELDVIPIDIDQHNKLLVGVIADISKRIITKT